MSSELNEITAEESRQARLTAYALDQLEGDERREAEDELARDETARGTVEELRRLAGWLAAGEAGDIVADQALRRRIERRVLNSKDGHAPREKVAIARRQGKGLARERRSTWLVGMITICVLLVVVGGSLLFRGDDNITAQREAAKRDARIVALRGGSQPLQERRQAEHAQAEAELARATADRQSQEVLKEQIAAFDRLERQQRWARGSGLGVNGDVPDSFSREQRFGRWPSADGTVRLGRAPTITSSGDVFFYKDREFTFDGKVPHDWYSIGGGQLKGDEGNLSLLVRERQRRAQLGDLFTISPDGRRLIAGSDAGVQFWAEESSREQYAPITENRFLPTVGETAVSTFSIDVDTASYSNARRFLRDGALPPPDAVRIEEFINYFAYDYPQPEGDVPFSVTMETAECPWRLEHRLLRIGLKGKEIKKGERPAGNLVFLIDVSGSMSDYVKLPLLKQAMKLLVGELNEHDVVTIVTYAGEAGLRLDSTPGDKAIDIRDAIDSLSSGGSTNGEAGIELAYQKAQENFIEGGVNRVILATDGDLNVGVTDDEALVQLIKDKAAGGVFLTVLGFGTGNLQDGKLEKLADNGNGLYAYIDTLGEGRKMLVEQIGGSLVTIAKDVKLQLEFNPVEVAAYRLIGYENRLLAAEDFDDDTKDAGEIGAGHTVTALYELIPALGEEEAEKASPAEGEQADSSEETAPPVELKYQKPPIKFEQMLTDAAGSGELLTVALRYKEPDGQESRRIEFTAKDKGASFNRASADFQFAASVASFGMLLRGSAYCGDATFASVAETASAAKGDDPQGYRAEFVELVQKADELAAGESEPAGDE